MAVVAMGGEEIVIRPGTGDCRHAGRFLSDVQVVVTPEMAFVVQTYKSLLEMPNEQHPAAKVE
jgi:hypothetical protein